MTYEELQESIRVLIQSLTNAMRQHSKQLKGFWYLDENEYSLLYSLLDTEISKLENTPIRDRLVIIKEKIDYIISNGLCKKYTRWIYKK